MLALTVATHTPVKIHLTTKVMLDDYEESFELVLFGQHYQKKNGIYLKYDEVQEEGTIQTIVKIQENMALILRSGLVKMRLHFQLTEQRKGTHESAYGTFLLMTDTQTLEHTEQVDPCKGRFYLVYDLYMEGTKAGTYQMEIKYEEDHVNS